LSSSIVNTTSLLECIFNLTIEKNKSIFILANIIWNNTSSQPNKLKHDYDSGTLFSFTSIRPQQEMRLKKPEPKQGINNKRCTSHCN